MPVDTGLSQTLSRGIVVLETLARAGTALSLRDLVERLELPRTVVYRLVKTLQAHRLVRVLPNGGYDVAPGLFALARGVGLDLRGTARPILEEFAEELRCTAVLSVVDGDDVVCLVSVEPSRSELLVTHREGRRTPLDRGASGIAASAALPPREGERRAVAAARRVGYAVSQAELAEGTVAASAPIRLPNHGWTGAVSLLFVDALAPTPAVAGAAAIRAAHRIEETASA